MESAVREAAALPPETPLHPSRLGAISKQRAALDHADNLLKGNVFQEGQLGIFAEDLGSSGAKTFFVDTFAGFALASARRAPPTLLACPSGSGGLPQQCPSFQERRFHAQHFYEVIRDGKPCWLYFDLEFNRTTNPARDPAVVIETFYHELDKFLQEKLGSPSDPTSVVELDSSNQDKFSKHVLVKRLQNGQPLAFAHNAHAYSLVTSFVEHLRTEQERGDVPQEKSLFFCNDKASGDEGRLTAPLIDECVYSRNRCFRLLFSSKFGKNRPLVLTRGKTLGQLPALQLLDSMAAFVPVGTVLLTESQLPAPAPKAGQPKREVDAAGARELNLHHVAVQQDSPYANLFDFLRNSWNRIREEQEPGNSGEATRVQSSVVVGEGRYLCVTLANNRFCYRKGASHRSNSIYLVVDLLRKVYYQKCHDVVDCGRDFRSTELEVPSCLIPGEGRNENVRELSQKALSQVVEETQLILSQAACDMSGDQMLLFSTSQSGDEGLTQTLRMCSSLVEPTLIVATPPSRGSSILPSTPPKTEFQFPTCFCNRWSQNAEWSLHFAPTMKDGANTAESEVHIERTQLDPYSESQPNSLRITEVDSESELESIVSQSVIEGLQHTHFLEDPVEDDLLGGGGAKDSQQSQATDAEQLRPASQPTDAEQEQQPSNPGSGSTVIDQLLDTDDEAAAEQQYLGGLSSMLWAGDEEEEEALAGCAKHHPTGSKRYNQETCSGTPSHKRHAASWNQGNTNVLSVGMQVWESQ
eukprot:TRINITY_DN32523_c0_g1_i1.p1 TRINITY_DN32523_c0_g1~~TRINITY_DN32523_c0_g1_i1.p1  ORF type:complete len:753 (+),score=147.69 TRINITY_DN32523_c0_g1_i1:48-2306(+)